MAHHTIGLDQETKDILRAIVDKVGIVLDPPPILQPWTTVASDVRGKQEAWLDEEGRIVWLAAGQRPSTPGFMRLCLVEEDY